MCLSDTVAAVAAEAQAIKRVFRPFQQRNFVRVHRLLLVGPDGEATFEEDIFENNTAPENLERATSDAHDD